ncbi:MAG: ATP-binding cassette domain-containing protein, partial [Planctomycetes bacterium]|nr:ATP-binding cassette domain-containing protein [Planctomycetota bacterium]
MSPRPPASPSTIETSHLLRAEGLDLGYRTPLLREVTLEVRAGERIAICGPNGAGKTTLFRGLLGLLEPLGGSLQRESLRVGFVPQREQLDPLFPLTTLEVVLQGAVPALTGLRRHRSEA